MDEKMEAICIKIKADEKLTNEEINFFLKEISDYLYYEHRYGFKQMREEKREYSMEMLRNFFGKNRNEYIKAYYVINKMAREQVDNHKNLIMSMRHDFSRAIHCPKNSVLALLVKERELLYEYYRCRRDFYHDNTKYLEDNCFVYNEFTPMSSENLVRLDEIQENINVLRKAI